MAKFGGKQLNAGRPVGSLSTRTKAIRAIADQAIAEGVHPLHVMLENMRFYYEKAVVLQTAILKDIGKKPPLELLEALKELGSFRNLAQSCAVDAAPYVHPRLSATSADVNVNIKVEEADAAFREIEGTLEQVVSGSTIEPGSTRKMDLARTS